MKDGLGAAAVERIAAALSGSIRDFPTERFAAAALAGLDALELKERVNHLIAVLNDFLPDDFEQAAEILIGLKTRWDRGDPNDNLGGFAAWPLIDYVGEHGLAHPRKSLAALKELTSMFSAEFAIRPFLVTHSALTLRTLDAWSSDPDEHVRRLVSEGARPRLPWGRQLPEFIRDPSPVLPLLEKLKDDPSEYVRRSVANHLNDISKDHPEPVIALCARWNIDAPAERRWIIRHATRSLVKAGHPAVFGLLGYTEKPELELHSLKVAPAAIALGESIEFVFELQSTRAQPQTVVIDYAVHHMKANGKTTPKVFKLKALKIAAGERVELSKRHAIKAITTRKYHAGEHAIEILINGKPRGRSSFTLRVLPRGNFR